MKNRSYALLVVLVVFLLYLATSLHVRYNHETENQYAWYIILPGVVEIGYPEDTFSMKDWAYAAPDSTLMTEDSELAAANYFMSTGVFEGYTVKKIDGHWALYRPESSEKVWSLQAFYRVTPFFEEK